MFAFRLEKLGFFVVIGITFGVLTSVSAAAQGRLAAGADSPGWLEDRNRTEGPGFRAGNLEIHPGLGAEFGYDNNVFYSDQNQIGSAILRVTPHIMVTTLGEERLEDNPSSSGGDRPMVEFRGGASGSFYQYFESLARSNVSGQLGLNATFNPGRPFNVTLFDTYVRTIRPFANTTIADVNFARNRNDAGIEFRLATPGKVLGGSVQYVFGFDLFEQGFYRYNDNLDHTVRLSTFWQFLPQTALVYEVEGVYQDYTNPTRTGATAALSDNLRLRSRIGVNGAITRRFSFSIFGGYAGASYNNGDDFDEFIGQAEARYGITETIQIAGGVDRDIFNSFVGNFYRRDRVYLRAQAIVAGAFLLGLQASGSLYTYGTVLSVGGGMLGNNLDRQDLRPEAGLFAEYRITNWLAFNGSFNYRANFSDFEYSIDNVLDPSQFNKFEAWVGTRAFF